MADNQQVTFLTDGGEDTAALPRFLNPQAEHLLDWFHITMRITVLRQMTRSLPEPPPSSTDEGDEDAPFAVEASQVDAALHRAKWFLWHGNTIRALGPAVGSHRGSGMRG